MQDFNVEIEKSFKNITMRLYDNEVMNVIFHDNCYIDIRDIEEVMIWMKDVANGRMFVNLMEGGYNTDLAPEVREFSASSEENKYTIADAIVISSQAHDIVSNFYVKFNKPVKPTKIFTDRSKAIEWLLEEQRKFRSAQKAS
ncbi:hypothetical protein CRYO30217_00538 [Parvicella tangerina]|uniref:DUF7793 domain-containing protein n=2 Tax=Parvicella tangerina TaxID=2829795 RepID=A0A916NQ08_9FLAO|nr:hypothetical protein CRYO30217_00538 [Parvicella tangerina]